MSRAIIMLRTPVLTVVLLAFIGGGCGTRKMIVPEVDTTTKVDFSIRGKIIYEGKQEYLPVTVQNDNTSESSLIFRYTYDTVYGMDNTPQALPLFNPLSIVGFPIGGNTLVVAGNLEVMRGDNVVKSYKATCGFDVTRNLFYEGDTYTELRKEGLLAIRKNIEIQMYLDKDNLSSLMVYK